jgi:hypothetical protein
MTFLIEYAEVSFLNPCEPEFQFKYICFRLQNVSKLPIKLLNLSHLRIILSVAKASLVLHSFRQFIDHFAIVLY